MTGNITVHEASWSVICGHITFSLNFGPTYGKYRVRMAGGSLTIEHLDESTSLERQTDREDILRLIRQGDDAMWTWATFLSMWQGWADGWQKCKRQMEVEFEQERARQQQEKTL